MQRPGPVVLDASALLAYLRDDPGAELVADAISMGVVISAVNVAEVLSRAIDRGADPCALADDLTLALIRRLGGRALSADADWLAIAVDTDVSQIRRPPRRPTPATAG